MNKVEKIQEIINDIIEEACSEDGTTVGHIKIAALEVLEIASLDEVKPDDERIYPCIKCGTLRSKNEGGTTFTLCDECWEKEYGKRTQPDESLLLSDERIRKHFRDGSDDESYQQYIYQLGLHEQDAVNIARFGAVKELAHAEPLIRADERKKTLREVIKWLQDYAIHGSQTPLELVLDDLEIHSKYFKEANLKSGKPVKE